MPGENELGLAQLLQNFAPGNNTCSNNERLRDGGVFNGFFFGFSAVVDQVNTRRCRCSRTPSISSQGLKKLFFWEP